MNRVKNYLLNTNIDDELQIIIDENNQIHFKNNRSKKEAVEEDDNEDFIDYDSKKDNDNMSDSKSKESNDTGDFGNNDNDDYDDYDDKRENSNISDNNDPNFNLFDDFPKTKSHDERVLNTKISTPKREFIYNYDSLEDDEYGDYGLDCFD